MALFSYLYTVEIKDIQALVEQNRSSRNKSKDSLPRMRAAIVYSLFACCKARDVEIRPWLEDTLKRIPNEKDIIVLLPENWQPITAK